MTSAFRLLVLLIGLTPLFLVTDSLPIHGIVTAYVAFTVLVAARSIRPGEAAFLSGVIRPAVVLSVIPAIWIIIQCLPMPFNGLRHPIWISAEAALGQPLWGSISISPGDALLALARYFTACGLFFVATAVSIDRQRAEFLLWCLSAVTTSLSLLLMVHNMGGFVFLGEISSVGTRASITTAVMFGTVFSCATLIYAIERHETRRSRADFSRTFFIMTIVLAIVSILVTFSALFLFTSKAAMFAAMSGVGTFVLIVGFRRIGLGSKMGFVLAAVAVAVPLSMLARDFVVSTPDLSLRFLTNAPSSIVQVQRMILDSGWAGSGAGTYAVLQPIYQDPANPMTDSVAPTTMAGFLIELGRPAMWLSVIAALAIFAWLTRGALHRGRDSFFTATGASCTVVLTLEAFFDASLATSMTIVIAMSTLGLAVSQSVSRTAR